jgi:hypothetical protein
MQAVNDFVDSLLWDLAIQATMSFQVRINARRSAVFAARSA